MAHQIPLVHMHLLEETGLVTAVFTTREGGVSRGECATMNLSFKRKDDPLSVEANYRLLCEALDIAPGKLAISRQVHGDTVLVPEEDTLGLRAAAAGAVPEGDAWITDEPGVALIRHHADCVPVYLLDPERRCIGLVHAGWKGTVARIAQKTVQAMVARYGAVPERMLAVIGPSIGPCCFEITENVIAPLTDNFPGAKLVTERDGCHYGDLWVCNRLQLLEAGLTQDHVQTMGVCTACHTETYFSHRFEKGHTGTMASLFMLKA